MAKVSIIIPVYNVQDYLRECLNSVINQTITDIQIICINDGSTDNSLSIIREYEKKDSRILVIDKPNAGYGQTINCGLKKANGEYVLIIESDDFAEPNLVEKMYLKAKKYNADVVRTNYFEYDGKDRYVEMLKGFEYDKAFSTASRPDVLDVNPFYLYMCKKTYLDENNILLNETKGASYQDISYHFQVLFFAKRIVFLKDALLHYRVNRNESSINSNAKPFCVCDEFDYIWQIINNKYNINESLYKYIVRFQFTIFRDNYFRIASCYQYAFAIRWSEIIKKQKKHGWINDNMYESYEQNMICQLDKSADDLLKLYSKYNYERITIPYDVFMKGILSYVSPEKILIFGYNLNAEKINRKIKEVKGVDISGYIVSSSKMMVPNKNMITIDKLNKYDKDIFIIIAAKRQIVRNIYIQEIKKMGFDNIVIA